ncbi:PstS family phosphate ABC transporter substrate-binding protein [Spirochaeta dissipatitropha]
MLISCRPGAQFHSITPDPRIPGFDVGSYPELRGELHIVGSDTFHSSVVILLDLFRSYFPDISFHVDSRGSDSAVPALVEGVSIISSISRSLLPSEEQLLISRFGNSPLILDAAGDAIAVYVHPDNPIESLSLFELKRIFSADSDVSTWGDLGVRGRLSSESITRYGRRSNSGTYGVFRERILNGADFIGNYQALAGSSLLVRRISDEPWAIGYSGIGYASQSVKVLPLKDEAGRLRYPFGDDVMNASYPLQRSLSFVLGAPLQQNLPDQLVTLAFLDFVLSQEGQSLIAADGFLPLSYEVLMSQRESLGF